MCGDFNVERGSETLRILQADVMVELVTNGGFTGMRTSHCAKPGTFADYMLINRTEAVVRFDMVRP